VHFSFIFALVRQIHKETKNFLFSFVLRFLDVFRHLVPFSTPSLSSPLPSRPSLDPILFCLSSANANFAFPFDRSKKLAFLSLSLSLSRSEHDDTEKSRSIRRSLCNSKLEESDGLPKLLLQTINFARFENEQQEDDQILGPKYLHFLLHIS
jgi:hypothetical protein